MSTLTPCPACARHVRERSCPFCGADVPPPAARPRFVGPVTRAAVFSVVTGAAVAGCWTAPAAGPATGTTTPTETTETTHAQQTPTQTETPPAVTGAIGGMVTDTQSGRPLAGAQVRLDDNQITTTDNTGHYRFDGVPPGHHQIAASTNGNRNHGGGAHAAVTVEVHATFARADVHLDVQQLQFDPSNIPKPYGAPPARRRFV